MDQTISVNVSSIQKQLTQQTILIAVTKTVEVERIQHAIEAGICHIGENRVQEAESKWAQLKEQNITWHLIGHLQKNKVSKALKIFDWIHSVDSLKLARRIDRIASELNKKPSVLMQVKMAVDESKFGMTPEEIKESLSELDSFEHIDVQGLMTIAPFDSKPAELLKIFKATRILAEEISQQEYSNIHMNHLSMGMSGDYELALKEGATMIRLGQKIFGSRV